MSFSIKNNKIFSNLHGRFVLTPDNPIYSGLVSSNNFIVKRDMIADSIKTSELELIGLCDEQKPKSSGFRINNDKIVHDIIMPKTISDELILLNPPYIVGNFGDSVSISGDTCIVGSPGYDGASTNQGAAYIYSKVDGVWVQDGPTLIGQNLEDRFGDSVAIYGDTCVVGAPLYNGGGADKGAAYIYNKVDGSWVQDGPTLIGQNNNDFFGLSVAIYGDTCIVGSPGYDGASTNQGAAYIYSKVDGVWVQDGLLGQPTLIGQNTGDNFGYSVAIHGYTCIVGAYLYGDGSDQGAAYIYSKVNGIWIQDGPTLIGQNNNDAFGRSVGISEDTCIVGAYTYDGGSNNKGAVYIYSKVNGDWVQEGLLGQPTLIGQTTDNLFGYSVAISGYTCVVGAFGYNGTNNGVYIFTLVDGHWVQNRLIVGDNNAIGISCAISCNTAIIGAASDNAYIVEGVLYKSDIQH